MGTSEDNIEPTRGVSWLGTAQSARIRVLVVRLSSRPTDHADNGPLVRRVRLGGLLNYYYREVARNWDDSIKEHYGLAIRAAEGRYVLARGHR